MDETYSENHGECVYRLGVLCSSRANCNSCGFNPQEEKLRSWTIEHQFKHRKLNAPYHLRIFRHGEKDEQDIKG